MLYTRTGRTRSQWFGKTTVLYCTKSAARTPSGARTAAAADGKGFAVWFDEGGEVWAAPLRQAPGKTRRVAYQNRGGCVQR